MTIAGYIEAGALLLSVGLNGLAIWFKKDYERMLGEQEELLATVADYRDEIETLLEENEALKKKVTPWNKGKTGYKHKPRTPKFDTYPTLSEQAQEESKKGGYTSESQL